MYKCPDCGYENPDTIASCLVCERALIDIGFVETMQKEENIYVNTHFCVHCDYALMPKHTYANCPFCNDDFENNSDINEDFVGLKIVKLKITMNGQFLGEIKLDNNRLSFDNATEYPHVKTVNILKNQEPTDANRLIYQKKFDKKKSKDSTPFTEEDTIQLISEDGITIELDFK